MGAAWEWRAFRLSVEGNGFDDLLTALMALGTWQGPPEELAEEDTYLVLPGQPHNFKVRDGCLEIKWLVARTPGGFGLWQNKEIWRFPLPAAVLKRLMSCRPDQPSGGEIIPSVAGLVAWLQSALNVTRLTLRKRRMRLTSQGWRLEAAELRIPACPPFLSVCIDGYDLHPVKAAVRQLALGAWWRPLSYVEMLQELKWWLPVLERREVTAAHAQDSGPACMGLL